MSVMRMRRFQLLMAADAISQLGTHVSMIALPLVAVLTLDATPVEVGLLTAAQYAGFLLVGLPAGVWVDRMRRRTVMIVADLVRGALLVAVPVAAVTNLLNMTQLYVVALLTGIATVFFDVAYQSYLPFLVGRANLMEGNARLETVRVTAQIGGPSAGGGLVQLLTAPVAVLADALSYLGSAAFLLAIREREPRPAREGRGRLHHEIRDGLAFVFGHPILRMIAACTSSSNFFGAMFLSLEILFLTRVIGLEPGQIGLLLSVASAGGLVGALLAPRLTRLVGSARVIWLGALVTWPWVLLVPLTTPGAGVALFAVGSFMLAIGVVVYNVGQVSFRQAITPESMLGRMNATMRFLVWGTLPLGGLAGGWLGSEIGLRAALWVSVAGEVAALVPLLLSPLRRLRDVPPPPGEHAEPAVSSPPHP